MHRVLGALLAFRDELTTRQTDPAFGVAHSTLNPGCIHGGDSANRIPALCSLDVDLRFLPGMSLSALRAEMHARAEQALVGSGLQLRFESLFDGNDAFLTERGAAIVKATEQLTGQAAGAVDFATEGSLLNELGMQTVVLGPGDIEQAHQPDESIPMARIEPTRILLTQLIRQFCL